MDQEQNEKNGFSLKNYRFWQRKHNIEIEDGTERKNILRYLKSSQENIKKISVMFGIYALCIVFLEFFYHIFAYGEIGGRIFMPIIFGVFWGLVFSFITILFRPKAQPFVGISIFFAAWILVSSQLIYYHIFGSSLSFSQFGMGTDAVTSFWHELLSSIGDIWYQLLILLLPGVGLYLGYRFHLLKKEKYSLRTKGYSFLCVALFYICSLGFLILGGTSAYGCYDLYHSCSMSTDLSVKGLGVLTTARLEVKYMIFGSDQDLSDVLASEAAEEELSDTDIYNMIDIDFDTMIESETDEDLITLDEYFSTQEATNKNEYTGYFEGYNLIELCCESFSPVFIDEELTPILYEMYHNGFIFNNYYTSWESNTTNGEYSLCMGIFPDNSRSKSDGSFKASADNYVPFCLGNMFGSIGVNAYGYHNYEGWYYARSYTYPNMGLTCKFAGNGMTFTNSWPASDLEMMEQSVSDYIDDDQFFVHYMTFSGHYRYDYDLNAMVRENWDVVEDLDYSDEVKAYISCNLELEYALEYLVQQLQESGQYENTVISLTCDHFPYGLSLDEYSELAGYEVDDDFGKYENAYILWSPSMEESVEVDDPMCTVDILPTVLNLWGFTYDSRVLVGKDILSDADHVAILSDGSFITDKIKYNSSTGEVTYLVDEPEVSESYVEDWVNEVKRRFTISTEILNTDYYRILSDFLNIDDVDIDTSGLRSSGSSKTTGNTGGATVDDDY